LRASPAAVRVAAATCSLRPARWRGGAHLALLIFCLIERQVRNALAPHGETMTGLPGYRLTPARPTGRTIFMALSDLRLIPAHDGNPAMIPKPAGVQAQLLDLLEINISRPRWLTK
jgi:hypothetical protein